VPPVIVKPVSTEFASSAFLKVTTLPILGSGGLVGAEVDVFEISTGGNDDNIAVIGVVDSVLDCCVRAGADAYCPGRDLYPRQSNSHNCDEDRSTQPTHLRVCVLTTAAIDIITNKGWADHRFFRKFCLFIRLCGLKAGWTGRPVMGLILSDLAAALWHLQSRWEVVRANLSKFWGFGRFDRFTKEVLV